MKVAMWPSKLGGDDNLVNVGHHCATFNFSRARSLSVSLSPSLSLSLSLSLYLSLSLSLSLVEMLPMRCTSLKAWKVTRTNQVRKRRQPYVCNCQKAQVRSSDKYFCLTQK